MKDLVRKVREIGNVIGIVSGLALFSGCTAIPRAQTDEPVEVLKMSDGKFRYNLVVGGGTAFDPSISQYNEIEDAEKLEEKPIEFYKGKLFTGIRLYDSLSEDKRIRDNVIIDVEFWGIDFKKYKIGVLPIKFRTGNMSKKGQPEPIPGKSEYAFSFEDIGLLEF